MPITLSKLMRASLRGNCADPSAETTERSLQVPFEFLRRTRAVSGTLSVQFRLMIEYRGARTPLNLYRIMTDVRAGPHQRGVAMGDLGIVTLWLRARSEGVALAMAKLVLANKRYGSIGELHAYAEVLANDPLAYSTQDERAAERSEDWILAGYDAMKDRALAQADGLHEVWLGASDRQVVRQQKIA